MSDDEAPRSDRIESPVRESTFEPIDELQSEQDDSNQASEQEVKATEIEGNEISSETKETGELATDGEGREDPDDSSAPDDKSGGTHQYSSDPVYIEQLEMLPEMNVYKSWTAIPGVPGEELDDVTVTLTFEAMGAQDLTVGLSHKPTAKGPMYQLIIGNKGNLQVDLQKRQGRNVETVASAAGLLCALNKAHKYWIAIRNGRIDFGAGGSVGLHTVLSFRDERSSCIEIRYFGFTCLRHRALFMRIHAEAEAHSRLVRDEAETGLEFIRAEGCDEGFSGEDKAALDSALEAYARECESMKKRARNLGTPSNPSMGISKMHLAHAHKRFGAKYAPPFLQDWMPWTLVKRLSWNRDLEGGIDPESREERQKRRLRAQRFGLDESNPASSSSHGSQNPLAPVAEPEIAELMSEEKRHARSQKFSIPDQMWGIQAKEQGLEAGDIFCRDPDRADPEPMASLFPHKIHVFSLDKMICKQIRDSDAKAYFQGFGPKYVEWLTDWSFNVVFDDEEEAKRAVASKSFALPESLPQGVRELLEENGVVEMGRMGWRLGVPMCKVATDRWGTKGQWVRILLRYAEAQDILMQRPSVPATPEGAIVSRPPGFKLPPAVRAAVSAAMQSSAGNGMPERRQSRDGGDRRDRGSKRHLSPEDASQVLGQALKSPRGDHSRRRRSAGVEAGAGQT